jgi:hypothetical protein
MSVPCREALIGSAHQVKGRERRGPRHQETTMPKHSLLKRRSSTDSKERKVMDPKEITEEPQTRTALWGRRHDEYTPQELAGVRS